MIDEMPNLSKVYLLASRALALLTEIRAIFVVERSCGL